MHLYIYKKDKRPIFCRKNAQLRRKFMITRSSIAFEDFLGSSIAPQVMPPCHELITWAGNPVWLNFNNIWKFEEGVWSQLDSSVTGPDFNGDFLLMVPDDFIPGC